MGVCIYWSVRMEIGETVMVVSAFDIHGQFQRLMSLKRRRKKKLTFDEAVDFIAACSGMEVGIVKRKLLAAGATDEWPE